MTLDKSLRFNEQGQCLAVPLVLEPGALGYWATDTGHGNVCACPAALGIYLEVQAPKKRDLCRVSTQI
jgi:hypothetical protein